MASQVRTSSEVMWNASPMASARPRRPTRATARSAFQVSTQSDDPSPWTMVSRPCRIRAAPVQGWSPELSTSGICDGPYVWDGRTMVTGNPLRACSSSSLRSQAILSREYSQNGLSRGVSSVMR